MRANPPPEFFTVHQGDARRLNRLLDPVSSTSEPLLSCTITSPPYAGLKNYGHEDQIGWGQPYDEYLVEMRRVFRAVAQHTKPSGSMWVIADSFRAVEAGIGGMPQRVEPLPFRLAEEAADSGWILRETVIWKKDKTLPWSSGMRLRNSFEYVLQFVRGPEYKFHLDRLRDPVELEDWWVKWPERYNPQGKAPGNVWEIPIPVQGSWRAPAVQHACPLPPDLVERLILLSTDETDVVFDPFAGTGVVVAEAERLGRRGLGVELNRDYVRAYGRAVRPATLARQDDDLGERIARTAHLRRTIPWLRALKYAKVVIQELVKEPHLPQVRLVVCDVAKLRADTLVEGGTPVHVAITLCVDAEAEVLDSVLDAAKRAADRPPLSKYGVAPSFRVVPPADAGDGLTRKRVHLYLRGRTWEAAGKFDVADLGRLAEQEWPGRKDQYTYPPIVSNVEVHEHPGRR